MSVSDDLRVSEAAERLLFRVAQEAIRNAARHSGAASISATVAGGDGTAVLEVADDGVGFDTVAAAERPEEGHLGLRLMEDLVRDAGGRFEIDSAPGRGTVVRVEVPAT